MSVCLGIVASLFFFFKQKTAYEMRISDWSSDVCSSDLSRHRAPSPFLPGSHRRSRADQRVFRMTDFLDRHGLSVDSRLARFVEDRALPGTGLDADRFWADFAALLARFAPENAALIARREALQAKIDAWHETRAGQPHDAAAYEAYPPE